MKTFVIKKIYQVRFYHLKCYEKSIFIALLICTWHFFIGCPTKTTWKKYLKKYPVQANNQNFQCISLKYYKIPFHDAIKSTIRLIKYCCVF